MLFALLLLLLHGEQLAYVNKLTSANSVEQHLVLAAHKVVLELHDTQFELSVCSDVHADRSVDATKRLHARIAAVLADKENELFEVEGRGSWPRITPSCRDYFHLKKMIKKQARHPSKSEYPK